MIRSNYEAWGCKELIPYKLLQLILTLSFSEGWLLFCKKVGEFIMNNELQMDMNQRQKMEPFYKYILALDS
jgi:hypothetical protein